MGLASAGGPLLRKTDAVLGGLRRQAGAEAGHHDTPIVALGHQQQWFAVHAMTMWARTGLTQTIAFRTFENDQHALIVPPSNLCVQMTLVPWEPLGNRTQ